MRSSTLPAPVTNKKAASVCLGCEKIQVKRSDNKEIAYFADLANRSNVVSSEILSLNHVRRDHSFKSNSVKRKNLVLKMDELQETPALIAKSLS